MKRMAIFSLFDSKGIADEYIYFLLQELTKVTDKIIVVVNGELQRRYVERIKQITPFIRFRENIGFDAGAYKESIVDLYEKNEMGQWDEIILLNDTFYGPFVPFDQIFDVMDKKKVDFWGLSYIDSKLFSHIQSYFLVFRKNVILSDDLYIFFKEYIDEQSTQIEDAYACFETGIFSFLTDREYVFDVYTHIQNRQIYANSFYLLSEKKLPILKKKFVSDKEFDVINAVASLHWIASNTNYNISLIVDSINRLYGLRYNVKSILRSRYDFKDIPAKFYQENIDVSREALLSFIDLQEEIYIYGAGEYARKMYISYLKRNNKFRGFVISDNEKMQSTKLYGYRIYRYSEIKNSSIIVALGKKNTEKVRGGLRDNSYFYICHE